MLKMGMNHFSILNAECRERWTGRRRQTSMAGGIQRVES